MTRFLAFALLSVAAFAESFHGRDAWVLQNDKIRVSALRGGGHIAEVRFVSDDSRKSINPMRVPHYQTIEPYKYDPAKHDALYGSDPHRWLSSGYMGQLLCFPVFGPPSSEAEVRDGLGNHGEAPIVEWMPLETPTSVHLRYGAKLPKTQYAVERQLTIRQGESVVYVEESVENQALFDRPINWVEHATFGPPFIAPGEDQLDLSGTKAQVSAGPAATTSLKPDSIFDWPNAVSRDGKPVSARPFQPVAHAGVYYAVLMDTKRAVSFFTICNPNYSVLIGYLFRTADSPWIGDFQENERAQTKPWGGKTVTRGIEFGTTPFAEGLKKSVERGSLFGVPSYRWIGGKTKLSTTYAIFLAEIPKGFAGVADVRAEASAIVITERGSQRTITLPAANLSTTFPQR